LTKSFGEPLGHLCVEKNNMKGWEANIPSCLVERSKTRGSLLGAAPGNLGKLNARNKGLPNRAWDRKWRKKERRGEGGQKRSTPKGAQMGVIVGA